ncbi:hypothetical protein TIFTF001_038798 [Ficus carica]|uniref:Ubiquitin-like protease family profile domain-containing protein n=1 Tax=Ficus carica TaxID=3494 RepID=A0AA88JAB3_FICCA|nr:hypothetical protein TIFTF001_038794 [Ficus carica]GMN69753.1 hypothetical protein TIFTF001_038798 [Ficus carica]
MQSSRENVEVSVVKRQLAVLERTLQELCAKQGINRETMAEENTAPTVDQLNSFKASCTQNEKEPGPSDPQPTPNASKECQLFLDDTINGGVVLVAIGRAYMDCVPTDTVREIPLECCEREDIDQQFGFISLILVSPVQQGIDRKVYRRKRANNILRILTNAPKGKLYLMPYNSGRHWILAVIDPWDNSIIYFNPLRNESSDDFHDLIKLALNDWKILVGKGEIIALSHGTPLRASETSCTLSGSAQIAQGPLLDNSTDDNREGLQESYHDDVENVPTGPIDIAELPSTTPEAEETISDAPASVANVEDTNALAPASEDPTAGNNGLEDVRVSQSCETLENPVTLGDKADKKNLSSWSQAPNIHAFLELFETGESRGPLVEITVDHSGEITLFKGVGVPLETVPFPEMAFA